MQQNFKKSILVCSLALLATCSGLNAFAQPNPVRKDIVSAFKGIKKPVHINYVASVFDCDENKKLHEFTLLLTPNGYIQFGSNPKIVGRQNVENMLIEFNKTFKHLSQHIIKVFKDTKEEIVYSADATYSFDDGYTLDPIPYMVHLTFKGDVVSEYTIYIDLAPFYQHLSKK